MEHFSWLQLLVDHHYVSLATVGLSLLVLLGLGVMARRSMAGISPGEPAGRFSARGFFEVILNWIVQQSDGILGKGGRVFVPYFLFLFLFIFTNNALGLIPGFSGATADLNLTLGVGLLSFALYNIVGVRAQGLGPYLLHFAGPLRSGLFVFVALLLFAIELVSHLFRPFTLGLRLMGNMTGDHTVLSVFLDLVPVGVPVIFYGLGLFISVIQALVFTLLTMVYVSMANSH